MDPLRSLTVMAAENMAEHMPVEEDVKLAPHHVALINNMGIKRRATEWTDKTNISSQTQKKARRDEQEIEGEWGASNHASIKTGMLPTEKVCHKNVEGQADSEELERSQDNRNKKTAVEYTYES